MNKISIIVPIYNTEKYLTKCLDSITHQSHQDLQIILIDDGSTDASSDIAEDYALKDPRITVIHQPNRGQSSARNLGLKFATGDYICFIDSDDRIKPSYVHDLLAPFLAEHPPILSVCGMHFKRLKTGQAESVYLSPLRARTREESFKSYILFLLATDGRMYSSVNKLFRAEIVTKLHFDEHLNFAEDTKFVLDYLKSAAKSQKNPTISFVLKPLYIYNSGTETSTMRSIATNWTNWQTSYQNLKSWLGPRPTFRENFWLHVVHLRWRISHLKQLYRAHK